MGGALPSDASNSGGGVSLQREPEALTTSTDADLKQLNIRIIYIISYIIVNNNIFRLLLLLSLFICLVVDYNILLYKFKVLIFYQYIR